MPDQIPKERLQPALLDRLEDDEPDKSVESRNQRVLSPRQLHECVRRDLVWLLNAGNLASAVELEGYPEVASSVLNYGVMDLTGRTMVDADIPAIERSLRQSILDFEPRILPESLDFEVLLEGGKMNHNRLAFIIRGELWAHPIPLELFLRTEVDLETGSVSVTEGET